MQTLFYIIVLFYYLSLLAELYWLAVPSPVSNYEALKRKKSNRFYIILLSTLGLVAFVLPLLNTILSFLGWSLMSIKSPVWLIALSIIIILIGRFFTLWGTINIRKHLLKNKNSVLKSGIFSKSRHPIATGLIISLIGFNLVYLNGFLLLFSIIFVIDIHQKILKEENILLNQHSFKYEEYQNQSRRYL